jgi:hypothetical protein
VLGGTEAVDVTVDGVLVVAGSTVEVEPEAEDPPLEPHADASSPSTPTTTMHPNQRAPMDPKLSQIYRHHLTAARR